MSAATDALTAATTAYSALLAEQASDASDLADVKASIPGLEAAYSDARNVRGTTYAAYETAATAARVSGDDPPSTDDLDAAQEAMSTAGAALATARASQATLQAAVDGASEARKTSALAWRAAKLAVCEENWTAAAATAQTAAKAVAAARLLAQATDSNPYVTYRDQQVGVLVVAADVATAVAAQALPT